VLEIVYLILVLMTLRTYGRKMDAKWQERVERWTKKHRVALTFNPIPGYTSDINYALQNGNSTWVPSTSIGSIKEEGRRWVTFAEGGTEIDFGGEGVGNDVRGTIPSVLEFVSA
jgi:hypothetical protein